jgi:hypothetical protein
VSEAYVESLQDKIEELRGTADHRALVNADLTRTRRRDAAALTRSAVGASSCVGTSGLILQ